MPVFANSEIVWAIIIVASLIAQIVKGAKRVSSNAPGKSSSDSKGGDSRRRTAPSSSQTRQTTSRSDNARRFTNDLPDGRQDVDDFFRKLAGELYVEPPEPKRAVPMPPPVQRPRQRPVAPQSRPADVTRKKASPTSLVKGGKPRLVQTELHAPSEPTRRIRAEGLRKMLRNRNALQQAIVLREIIGQPLGLR